MKSGTRPGAAVRWNPVHLPRQLEAVQRSDFELTALVLVLCLVWVSGNTRAQKPNWMSKDLKMSKTILLGTLAKDLCWTPIGWSRYILVLSEVKETPVQTILASSL